MCYVPRSLNWVKLPPIKKCLKNQVIIILEQILVSRSLASEDDEKESWFKDGFAILNAKVLKKITREYKAALDFCLDNRIIEPYDDGTYKAGVISRRFRISRDMFQRRKSVYEHMNRIKMGNRFKKEKMDSIPIIKKILGNISTYDDMSRPEMIALLESMQTIKTKVAKARNYLQKKLDAVQDNLNIKKSKKEKMLAEMEEKFERAIMQLESFHRNIYFSIDDYGRLHTNLTSLKKLVRKFCYFSGYKDELYDILDFANFQPWILSQLLDPSFRKKFRHIIKKIEHVFKGLMITEDMLRFKEACEAGTLWDDIAKEFDMEKDIVKKRNLTFFFSNNQFASRYGKYFKDKYPGIVALMDKIKTKKYQTLSHILQKLESEIVYKIICKSLVEGYSFKLMATIHDSFFILNNHKEFLAGAIKEILIRNGIKVPVLKDEKGGRWT